MTLNDDRFASVDAGDLVIVTVYVLVDESCAVTVMNIDHVLPTVKLDESTHEVIVAYVLFFTHVILTLPVYEYAKFTVYHVVPLLNAQLNVHPVSVNEESVASVEGAVLNIFIEYPHVVVPSSALTTTVNVHVCHNANVVE